jgi:FkbM family methyltransferase
MKDVTKKLIFDLLEDFPVRIIDIGGKGDDIGIFSDYSKLIEVIAFDPRAELVAPDESIFRSITKIPSALWSSETEKLFYQTKHGYESSFFEPDMDFINQFEFKPKHWELEKTYPLKVSTLDKELTKANTGNAHFIKIDTQGAELDILKGGAKTLENSIFGIRAEVEFSKLYKDQPLFADVDSFIREYNFDLFDLDTSGFKKYKDNSNYGDHKARSLWGEALYFRSPESSLKLCLNQHSLEAKEKMALGCILTVMAYRYFDYALKLHDTLSPCISKKTSSRVIAIIESTFKDNDYVPLINPVYALGNIKEDFLDTLKANLRRNWFIYRRRFLKKKKLAAKKRSLG